MTDIYEKSLKMLDETLENATDEQFWADYMTIRDPISRGPTIDEYLRQHTNLDEHPSAP